MTVTYLPTATTPDRDLATRFTREVEPLIGVLARAARRLTRCEADAEDLLQDTLLRAYTGFHTFEEGTNLRAWLFRILHNHWISSYRAKQSRVVEVLADSVDEFDLAASASRLPGSGRSAESELLESLPCGDIKAAMSALPEGFAEVLYYADAEGYTYAETAAILGIPVGTVMSRTFRGRKRLRITLAHLAPGNTESVAPSVVA
ncbi:sigma-70 family RNA polymerase sigma factor [Mycobacterium sp. SMC-4]|uniref:sigma-70 family RNA polymerase sigma factor n=1 Tax=Mycobacterium sp. SMC-4 TaxID=2857059 RepID=UPI0021B2FE73|nr:sigma-70 family RNA polymerase sigma factor [Mycobacterium sp. SMC-4]UXA16088.1 sigma-70 family RNA polymerase sigma factor [Mycobacterium sp. SMC-4]